jgi:hypothetical protein
VLDNLFPIIIILKVNGAARGSFFSLCKSERFSPLFFHLTFALATNANLRREYTNGQNGHGKAFESAEEEVERTGRRRLSRAREEKRRAGKVERVEEASRRRREVRERVAKIKVMYEMFCVYEV